MKTRMLISTCIALMVVACGDSTPLPADGGATADAGVEPRFVGVGMSRKRVGCGIRNDGRAICWGRVNTPAPTASMEKIDGGDGFMCGLQSDKSITCWLAAGVVVPGDPQPELAAPSGSFQDFAAGFDSACAVSEGGALSCWGLATSPVVMATLPTGPFVQVDVKLDDACALRGDDSVVCFGGTRGTYEFATAAQKVQLLDGQACVLGTDGIVRCGETTPVAAVAFTGTFVDIAANEDALCALRASGEIVCDGLAGTPPVTQLAGPYRAISMIEDGLCAVTVSGALDCRFSFDSSSDVYGLLNVPSL